MNSYLEKLYLITIELLLEVIKAKDLLEEIDKNSMNILKKATYELDEKFHKNERKTND